MQVTDTKLCANPLPFTSAFEAAISQANAFIVPGLIRRYQDEVLTQRAGFAVISPFSGSTTRARRSIVLERNAILFEFHDAYRFWLLAEGYRTGFPITAMLHGDDPFAVKFVWKHPTSPERIRAATQAISRHWLCTPSGNINLLIGHPNFAHYAWNELSGLAEWAAMAPQSAIDSLHILSTYEPFGSVNDIVPELRHATVALASSEDVNAANSNGAITLRLGSVVLSKRVRGLLDKHGDRTAKVPEPTGIPRFWLSIRTKNRTPTNQIGFLVAMICRMLSDYPRAHVFLDGFSYPLDIHRHEALSCAFDRAVEATRAVATVIIDQVVNRGFDRIKITDITGLTIVEALKIARGIDYYVCHEGSIQHKVGWFHVKPGTVHSPNGGPTLASWYKRCVEGGARPTMLPLDFIEAPSAQGPKRDRTTFYTIDIERAVDFISKDITRVVG